MAENTFLQKVDTYLKLKWQKKKNLEKVLLWICDLWCLQNQHPQKQKNLSYLSHKEKSFTGASENTFLRKVDT